MDCPTVTTGRGRASIQPIAPFWDFGDGTYINTICAYRYMYTDTIYSKAGQWAALAIVRQLKLCYLPTFMAVNLSSLSRIRI